MISRLTNDVEALDQLVTDGVTSLPEHAHALRLGDHSLHPRLALALATLAVFPIMSVATAIFRRRSTRAYARVRETRSRDRPPGRGDAGVRVLQAFTREGHDAQRFRDVNEHYREATARRSS